MGGGGGGEGQRIAATAVAAAAARGVGGMSEVLMGAVVVCRWCSRRWRWCGRVGCGAASLRLPGGDGRGGRLASADAAQLK